MPRLRTRRSRTRVRMPAALRGDLDAVSLKVAQTSLLPTDPTFTSLLAIGKSIRHPRLSTSVAPDANERVLRFCILLCWLY